MPGAALGEGETLLLPGPSCVTVGCTAAQAVLPRAVPSSAQGVDSLVPRRVLGSLGFLL